MSCSAAGPWRERVSARILQPGRISLELLSNSDSVSTNHSTASVARGPDDENSRCHDLVWPCRESRQKMESWVNQFTQENSERCRKRGMFYTRNNRTAFPGVPFLSFPGCGLCSRLTRAIVQQVRFGGANRRMWYRRRAPRNCKPPAGRRLPSNGIVFTARPISNFYARIILSRRGIRTFLGFNEVQRHPHGTSAPTGRPPLHVHFTT